jgi:hypothetical protein
MTSLRSVEIKLGAEKPLKPEEAKRCELKPSMEIKRTAHIYCGGRVLTRPITYHHHVKEERVSSPVRRSERIRGMKRKDYKESPEPKDYGGSDYSDDRSPSSWAVAEREDNELFYWEEVPKEKTPEGPNSGGDPDDGDDGDNSDDPSDIDPFEMRSVMLCGLSSLHLRSLRIGRGVFLGYERPEVVWNGGQHEEQVVQELWKVPLRSRVLPPLGFL